MVAFHRRNNPFIGAEFLQNAHTYFNMCALHLVVQRFADVMHQGPGFGDCHVGAQFFGNHSGNVRHFNGMLEDVLPVAGAEIQPPDDGDNARVKIEYSAFIDRLFAFFLDYFIYFFFGFFHQLLNFSRLNAPVQNQIFQRQAGDLSPDRVKRRNDD